MTGRPTWGRNPRPAIVFRDETAGGNDRRGSPCRRTRRWTSFLVREPRGGPYERRACLLQAGRQHQGEQRLARRSGHSGPQVGAGALLAGGGNWR